MADAIVSGANYAKVRAMFDDQGANVKEATPGTPVRVIGWSGTPDSGASFKAVKNSREAEKIADELVQALRLLTHDAEQHRRVGRARRQLLERPQGVEQHAERISHFVRHDRRELPERRESLALHELLLRASELGVALLEVLE